MRCDRKQAKKYERRIEGIISDYMRRADCEKLELLLDDDCVENNSLLK